MKSFKFLGCDKRTISQTDFNLELKDFVVFYYKNIENAFSVAKILLRKPIQWQNIPIKKHST